MPGISQPALPPGQRYAYDFALGHPGTYWMHSHQGLQEQRLLAAPLIITDPAEAGLDEQPVVVLLGDFSFKDPIAGGGSPKTRSPKQWGFPVQRLAILSAVINACF